MASSGPLGFRLEFLLCYCRLTTGRDDEPLVHKNWKIQHWADNSDLFSYDRHSGQLDVKKRGLYYIYAQV